MDSFFPRIYKQSNIGGLTFWFVITILKVPNKCLGLTPRVVINDFKVDSIFSVVNSWISFKEFIELARNVYKLNDERAAIKLSINNMLGSNIKEVKSYE